MIILHKKMVILVKDETSISNTDSSSLIYLATAKVLQYIMVDENRRGK